MVMTTVGSTDAAEKISVLLINRRLAACVQEISINSRYRWKGKVNTDPEFMLLIKTASDRVEDVIAAIHEVHPYDLPEIICIPVIGGLPDYLSWVHDETR